MYILRPPRFVFIFGLTCTTWRVVPSLFLHETRGAWSEKATQVADNRRANANESLARRAVIHERKPDEAQQ